MLTRKTMLRALRLAASYGDSCQHYFDGRNDPGPPVVQSFATDPRQSGFVRKWDPVKGAYVYVEKSQ
jgi:hypothetical protein